MNRLVGLAASSMSYRTVTIALGLLTASSFGGHAIAQPTSSPPAAVLMAQSDTAPQPPPSQRAQGIQNLQTRLAQLGYYEGPTNGIYNDGLRDALMAFQQDNGLVVTGILDPITRQRLTDPDTPPAGSDATEPALAPSPLDSEAAPRSNESPDLVQPNGTTPTPSSPLPGDEAADRLIEADDPAAGLEDGIDDTPTSDLAPGQDASETLIAPNADSSSEGTDESTPLPLSDEAEAATNQAGLRLLLLGLVVVALGGIGTGLLLWLAKQSAQKQGHAETVSSSVSTDAEPPMAPATSDESVAAHNDRGGGNGHAAPTTARATVATSSMLAPDATSEPRTAKINIINELINDLHAPDPDLRHKAIWELGQRGNSAAMQPLTRLLMDADSHEQGLILAALAEISMQTLKPMNRAVAIALQDDNPEVRKNAIRDLTRIYDSLGQVGRLLGHATADRDPEVRETARWALDQLNHIKLVANEPAHRLHDSADTERLPEDGSST